MTYVWLVETPIARTDSLAVADCTEWLQGKARANSYIILDPGDGLTIGGICRIRSSEQ